MNPTGFASDPRARQRQRPPAPLPGERELSRLEILLRLRRNPLTIWRRRHFREPIIAGDGIFGYGSWSTTPQIIARTTCNAASSSPGWARGC
ncbi:MAG: hypothetical protein ABS59_02490 [Methylobacterium sp. SCN 67-24]|nr:MAG: hypothetical protein ABS59_02490 [Methylobacterium sp. SCN 67-24]